jgi:hypothetical protein
VPPMLAAWGVSPPCPAAHVAVIDSLLSSHYLPGMVHWQTEHASGTPPTTDLEWSAGVVQALVALEGVSKSLIDADAVRVEAHERALERAQVTAAAAALEAGTRAPAAMSVLSQATPPSL